MEKEEKVAVEAAAAEARRRMVIGVGFWVQGFRLFPWLGVNFFLKDGMGVAASSLQILQASANLPMVAKPLLGLLSDAVPIRGHRRLPYVAIGGTPTPPFPFTNPPAFLAQIPNPPLPLPIHVVVISFSS